MASVSEFERVINGCRLRLFNCDCLEGMRRHLAPRSVSVVVTSPPYNIGAAYHRYDDRKPREEYLAWLGRWAKAVEEVLADDGSLFLNIGARPSDPTLPFEVLAVVRRRFVLQNVIHWVKSIAILKEDAGDYPGLIDDVVVGHYKPINSRRFLNDCHEYVFHLTRRGDVELDRLAIGVPYQDKSNIGRWKSAGWGVHCRGNTWFIPYRTIKRRERDRPHPATFPVKLPLMCVRLHGVEKTRLVLDPFLGLGHTALACLEAGVDFAGFELDPEYFSYACRAIEARAGACA